VPADLVGLTWRPAVRGRALALVTADASGRAPARPPSPLDDPRVARELRRIALHQETAALLELRAQQATSVGDAELLRRRAVDGRDSLSDSARS
jgi:hypothetical protein